MTGSLVGAVVQRVDAGPSVIVLKMRLDGEGAYVILAAGARGGVGLVRERPWRSSGLPGGTLPEGERAGIRARLDGAIIASIGERHVVLSAPTQMLTLDAREPRVALHAAEPSAPASASPTWDELEREGERLVGELATAALEARRAEVARAVSRARTRVAKRMEAIRGDIRRIGEADEAAARGALFVAEAARAPRGATRLLAIDWSTGEPREEELALDPSRGAREQVDALFKRARRLKQGGVIAAERLREAQRVDRALEAATQRLASADTQAAIDLVIREARAAGPRDFSMATPEGAGVSSAADKDVKRAREAKSTPHRTFRDARGGVIFVGRSGEHNDALAFRVARPHDLWLHAKGWAGAHVVVPLDKTKPCPPDRLLDAAHLAAHFSEARGEAVVEVQHTARRYVRKPRGSAPGLVVVDREKVIVLRVDAARITRLLGSEERAPT